MSTTVRIAIGPVQERVERRTLVVGGILSLFVLAFSLFSIMSGPMDPSFRDVVTAVLGSGESTTLKVVQSVRLPRVITAIAVGMALAATGVADLASRRVEELLGGQKQRVWLSLVLAQETPLLLLDEPTTFLDITHQLDVLALLAGE